MKTKHFFFVSSTYDSVLSSISLPIIVILLSGMTSTLFSQNMNTIDMGEEINPLSPDSIINIHSLSEDILDNTCVNTFTNQTVSSNVSVLGCNTLTIENITVTDKGYLSLVAPDGFVIKSSLYVQPGGVLKIKCQRSGYLIFNYNYDDSGNRIARELSTSTLSPITSNTDDTETNSIENEGFSN